MDAYAWDDSCPDDLLTALGDQDVNESLTSSLDATDWLQVNPGLVLEEANRASPRLAPAASRATLGSKRRPSTQKANGMKPKHYHDGSHRTKGGNVCFEEGCKRQLNANGMKPKFYNAPDRESTVRHLNSTRSHPWMLQPPDKPGSMTRGPLREPHRRQELPDGTVQYVLPYSLAESRFCEIHRDPAQPVSVTEPYPVELPSQSLALESGASFTHALSAPSFYNSTSQRPSRPPSCASASESSISSESGAPPLLLSRLPSIHQGTPFGGVSTGGEAEVQRPGSAEASLQTALHHQVSAEASLQIALHQVETRGQLLSHVFSCLLPACDYPQCRALRHKLHGLLPHTQTCQQEGCEQCLIWLVYNQHLHRACVLQLERAGLAGRLEPNAAGDEGERVDHLGGGMSSSTPAHRGHGSRGLGGGLDGSLGSG